MESKLSNTIIEEGRSGKKRKMKKRNMSAKPKQTSSPNDQPIDNSDLKKVNNSQDN